MSRMRSLIVVTLLGALAVLAPASAQAGSQDNRKGVSSTQHWTWEG